MVMVPLIEFCGLFLGSLDEIGIDCSATASTVLNNLLNTHGIT
jgi:hypothetical protein